MTTLPSTPTTGELTVAAAAADQVARSRTQRSAAFDQAIAALSTSFAADPIIRWLFPAPQTYLEAFPALLRLLAEDPVTGGTLDRTDDGAGAAVWVGPDQPLPDEEVAALLVQTVASDRHDDVFAFFGAVQEHHPDTSHWYLPFSGVDPRAQGCGHGSTLLRGGLERLDADHLPGYLEASSPRNRTLYERHGFTVVGEVRAADSPPLWPMWRAGR
jgi:ribosomal protein S18 acetylase RimI-like enzyme